MIHLVSHLRLYFREIAARQRRRPLDGGGRELSRVISINNREPPCIRAFVRSFVIEQRRVTCSQRVDTVGRYISHGEVTARGMPRESETLLAPSSYRAHHTPALSGNFCSQRLNLQNNSSDISGIWNWSVRGGANDEKNSRIRKPVARICHWNSSESNEADEINDAKMIVERFAKMPAILRDDFALINSF